MAGSAVIGALRVVLGLDSAAFDSGAKKAVGQLAALEKSAKALQSGFNRLFAAMAGAGFVAFIRQSSKAGAEIEDVSQRLGLTIKDFQELAYAAKLAGVDQESFTKAFEQFNKRMGDFSGNVTESQRALGRLGISFDQIKGKNPAEQIRLLADGFQRLGPTQEAARISNDLFGKSGQAMLNVLIKGKAGLAAWAAEAQKAGVIIEDSVIKNAGLADDEFDRISASLKAASIRIAAEFLPVLKDIRRVVTSPEFQQGVKNLAADFNTLAELMVKHGPTLVKVGATIVGFKTGALAGRFFGPQVAGLLGLATAAGAFVVVSEAMEQEIDKLATQFHRIGNQIKELKTLQEQFNEGLKSGDGVATQLATLPELEKEYERIGKRIEEIIEAQRRAKDEAERPAKVTVSPGAISPDISRQIDELKLKTAELRGQLDGLGIGFASLLQGKVPLDTLLKGIQALSQEQRNLLAENAKYQIALQAFNAMSPWEKAQDDLKKLEASYLALIAVQGKAGAESAAEYTRAWAAANQKMRDIITQAVADIASNLAAGFKAFAEQNKKFAQAAKVAAIASALINTYQAATKALTAAPPPLNYALMAATIVAGLAQVAQIKAQSFAQGGAFKVPGGISGVDSKMVPLNLAAGEMVNITPADQVAAGAGTTRTIELRGRRLSDFLSLEDMRDLVDGLNSAGRDGYRLKVVT